MSLSVQGKVVNKVATETKTSSKGNEYTIAYLLLEIADGEYTTHVKFAAFGKSTAAVDGVNEGDDVEVFFNIKDNKEACKICFESKISRKRKYSA